MKILNFEFTESDTLAARQEVLLKAFAAIGAWEERYKKMIELGKALPEMPVELRTEEAKVKGCQSQVWLHAECKNGRVYFQADSDALIVKGLVSILLLIFSGCTIEEILADKGVFLVQMGFERNLSPSRTNGLAGMFKQIKNFAIVFQYSQKMQKE